MREGAAVPALWPAQALEQPIFSGWGGPRERATGLVFVGGDWAVSILQGARIEEAGMTARRVDRHNRGDLLKSEIVALIERAQIIVADLTNERPNCYLEVVAPHISAPLAIDPPWQLELRARARSGLSTVDRSGAMEVTAQIAPPLRARQRDLLTAARESNVSGIGWPIGIVLDNRDEYRPRPTDRPRDEHRGPRPGGHRPVAGAVRLLRREPGSPRRIFEGFVAGEVR